MTTVSPPASPERETPDGIAERRRLRAGIITALAALLVWFALIFPDQLDRVTPSALLRIPVEGLLLVAVCLVLPQAARRIVATVFGLALAGVAILKLINLGFFAVLGQPFNPLTDASYLKSAVGVLRDSVGPWKTVGAVVAATLFLAAVLVVLTRSAVRLTTVTARHRATSAWAVCTLAVVWLLCAALGVQVAGGPVAVTTADAFTRGEADPALAAEDAYAATPGAELLTGLRGKDVLLVFVESYGRVAIEDPAVSPEVNAVLTRSTDSLRAAGYSSRSAFLTSSTYAGISWLAHGTLQSGLWIDSQGRYNQLLQTERLTLSSAFKRAGWRTVAAVPSNTEDWPEGKSFYQYDAVYDSRNVGYVGPKFGYASMPDQYTLAALQRHELAQPDHSPVMAEIDLVSSHGPWAPLPRMVDWTAVGDGSVFADMPAQGQSADEVIGDPELSKAAYGESIRYSLTALISYMETYGDDDLVVVAVGDHQPAAVVSGEGASRDVPITIIAHDTEVMDRIASWGWQPGMRPDPAAPVWPMDAFRDRFLTAYGPG
jgi:hypothetical protein